MSNKSLLFHTLLFLSLFSLLSSTEYYSTEEFRKCLTDSTTIPEEALSPILSMKTIDDTNDCNVYSSSNFTEEIKGEVCARIQFCVISTFGNLNWPQKAQVKAKVCKEKEKLNKCILSKISKKERKDIQMAYKAKKGQSGTKPGRHIYVEDEQAWINSVKDLISKKTQLLLTVLMPIIVHHIVDKFYSNKA